MSELVLLAGLLGLGYSFNKNGINRNKLETTTIESGTKPTGTNIYNSDETVKIWQEEQKGMNKRYQMAADTENNNIVIPGPPQALYKKTDYQNDTLPVIYKGSEIGAANTANYPMATPKSGREANDMTWSGAGNYSAAGGWSGTSLTGNLIDPKNFKHRNMTPFFGSTATTNMDEYVNQTKLENFTGAMVNYKQKSEISPMFKPQKNVGNPYGMENLSGYNYDRYIVGNKRANESPVELTRVGPGLNQGYTAKPSGGFQQSDKRDYLLPKTTNEIRVKTNPKLSYYGRVIAGKHISRPEKIGIVRKNRPDAFYMNTPDRWFTTVGDVTKPRIRPSVIIRHTNRKTTGKDGRVGPAAPVVVKRQMAKNGKVVRKFRVPLGNGGWRNVDGERVGVGSKADFGKKNLKLRPQQRECVNYNDYKGVVAPTTGGKNPVNSGNNLRPSRRQNVIGNGRVVGNPGKSSGTERGYVKSASDVAKTTTKETTLIEGYVGDASGQEQQRGGYKLVKAIAKPTNRMTTTTSHIGGAHAHERKSGSYKIMKVKAPNTNRQFTADIEYYGGSDSKDKKTRMMDDINNHTIRSNREAIAKGRAPTRSSQKVVVGSEGYNLTKVRNTEQENRDLSKRGVIGNSVIPKHSEKATIGVMTNQKVDDRNVSRFDPTLVDKIGENPLVQKAFHKR